MLYKRILKDREVSVELRIRLLNAAVVSVLLYGADTWPASKTAIERRLKDFELEAAATLCGVGISPRTIQGIKKMAERLKILEQHEKRKRGLCASISRPGMNATYRKNPSSENTILGPYIPEN